MSDSPVGPIDTNVFVHAQTTDSLSEECRQFLTGLERGQLSAYLEPVVLHELSYALRRYREQFTKSQVADYTLTILSWPGIHAEKPLLIDAIDRWASTPDLGFVDAYLAGLATQHSSPVYTKNVRHFADQGVTVPDLLPDGSVA